MESRGWERRRRDLNPRGAMHPYLLSREAHSTGLCDVSSADYSRPFSPRARTAPAASAQEAVGSAEGEGFEPPVPLLTQRFSRPSLSATQTALQTCLILQERAARCRQRGHSHRESHERMRTLRQGAALPWDRARTCRAHTRGKPQAPEARPHRPRAGGRYPDTAVSTNDVNTPRVRNKGAGPGHSPRARPLSQRRQPCQPRRPKKFQDFLSGAGSSGWSRRPRESAGAVGGHRGTRMASIAWIAW